MVCARPVASVDTTAGETLPPPVATLKVTAERSAAMADTSILFQPTQIGPLTLKNRFVMAPMTRGK